MRIPDIPPHYLKRFHWVCLICWCLLVPPTVLFWAESIMYLVFMSIWTIIVGHFVGWAEGRREEREVQSNGDE